MVLGPGIADEHPVAAAIVSWLNPSSVVGFGEDTRSLVQALAACGVPRVVHADALRLSDGNSESYDLALYAGPLDQAQTIVRAAAGLTERLLLCFSNSDSQSVSVFAVLRVFDEAGFSPEFSAPPWFASRAVLFRRGTGPSPGAREKRQEELERLLHELRVAIAETRERHEAFAEKLEGRVAQLQSAAMRQQHATQGILLSRTWRTLVAAGGLLLGMKKVVDRIVFRRPGTRAETNKPGGETFFRIFCDEPAATQGSAPEILVSGDLSVRGWALAGSGIRRMEIQVGDAAPVEVRYGFYRPDVAAQYPDLPDSELCGFRAKIDTALLPNGRQFLTMRAFSAAGATTEMRVPVMVDHSNGYASDYHRWIAEFEKEDDALIRMKIPLFAHQPVVSVILPVYQTPMEILERSIASMKRQSYPHWELCIADDGSRSPGVDAVVDRHSRGDERVRVVRLPVNQGISAASNAALGLARGEFVALLDHDDELSPNALYHFVDILNREPEGDIFYSDEDHIDESGFRSDPFFKPDWSPDLILAENYVNHLLIFRRARAAEVGGFRTVFDLSQDHDLLLRMSVKARKILHIPKILYHWRTDLYAAKRASHGEQRAIDSSRRAVEDYLSATGARATVEPGEISSRWRARYAIPEGQRVQILIPSARADLLERCLRSVKGATDYTNYEIAVLDNSRSDRIERLVRRWGATPPVKHVDLRDRPFNFSALNNAAARESTAPLLLFLNDDITVINPGWLTAMVELASRPEVGAVGAKLLYPDGTIQHAGVVLGLFGICGHAFKGACAEDRLYFDFPSVIRDVSAVTAACMMVPAKRFQECGGFDEDSLPIAYQDVDLCLKLRQKGYRVLFTPHARLYHHEATSKRPEDKDPSPLETITLQNRWKAVIEHDPFYNPNLTRDAENYGYRRKG